MLEKITLSGTTGFTTKRNGRNYISVGINPTFYRLAEKRIAAEAYQGRSGAWQADSAKLSALPEKTAQNAPKSPEKVVMEET